MADQVYLQYWYLPPIDIIMGSNIFEHSVLDHRFLGQRRAEGWKQSYHRRPRGIQVGRYVAISQNVHYCNLCILSFKLSTVTPKYASDP